MNRCVPASLLMVLSASVDAQAIDPGFEGDSLFAWDETRKAIVYYIWGSVGSHRPLEAQYIGDERSFPVPARADASKVAYRSVWRRIDPDTFEVRRERPDGEGWSTELTVTYRRAAHR